MCGTLRVPRLDYGTRSDRPTGAKASLAGSRLGRAPPDPSAPVFDSRLVRREPLETTFELSVVAVLE